LATQNNPIPSTAEQAAPENFLTRLAFGVKLTQALYVAAKLGIADMLAQGPRSISKLAVYTGTHERSLYRVLRSLASVGVFREVEPKVFALTHYADALRSDAPNSFRNFAIFIGEKWVWKVLGEMHYSVQTGKPAWGHVHGAEAFDYFADNKEESEIFNRAMTDLSVAAAPVVVEAYNFSEFRTLVDIAGGHGYLLAQVLKANPHIKGTLFDLPQVIAGAGLLLENEGVSRRVEQVAGDFFDSVPGGADAYMMKHIIHDWDDERSVRLLNNIRAAMPPGGKVLIVETVVPEGNEPHYSKLMDLGMLVMPGGLERTAQEYRALLAESGLELNRIIPTRSSLSIIEAVNGN
jgi:hypothetical protein